MDWKDVKLVIIGEVLRSVGGKEPVASTEEVPTLPQLFDALRPKIRKYTLGE
jgi:hypothetical protein